MFLYLVANGFVAKDCTGYLTSLNKKIRMIITLDGRVILFDSKTGMPLRKCRYKRAIRYMQRTGFIREGELDPFPEYEMYTNLELNPNKTILIRDTILTDNS